jgi:hypothetical protein
MNYKNYEIKHDGDHYRVIAPDGVFCPFSTIRDAKDAIDEDRGE